MAKIALDDASTDLAISKLREYFQSELDTELGSFEAQFLLDFFSEQVAHHYYNKGLADALSAMDKKMEEVGELVYELEQPGPGS